MLLLYILLCTVGMKYTTLWSSYSPYSYTPLMEAAREGHEDVVALLIEQGNVNVTCYCLHST